MTAQKLFYFRPFFQSSHFLENFLFYYACLIILFFLPSFRTSTLPFARTLLRISFLPSSLSSFLSDQLFISAFPFRSFTSFSSSPFPTFFHVVLYSNPAFPIFISFFSLPFCLYSAHLYFFVLLTFVSLPFLRYLYLFVLLASKLLVNYNETVLVNIS